MIKEHWSNYEPYAGEVVRFVAPIGKQFFVMELQRCDDNFEGDDMYIDWNVIQCIVDEVTDEAIYTVDEFSSTGKSPMLTYAIAKRGLAELVRYMSEEYQENWPFNVYHNLYADGADERRAEIYKRVLGKMGWKETLWYDTFCQKLTVKGRNE